ncbi:MAG: histidine phosphatase family protein [Planctomycetaceae bacterium]|nr:histidine phosphatase family protein [Planctomycetaceae bacterium]
MKQVHLVRHGEPEAGYTRRFLGRVNPGLSPEGVRQAERIAGHIAGLAPDRILTSPLRRAADTADIIARACRLPAERDDRLLEIDFGQLEGLTFKEASGLYPGITDSWQALAGDFSFPGGENFRDFDNRAKAMADFVTEAPEKNILLVAHGGILRGVLCHLLAVEADGPLRFRLAYAAPTTVVVYDDAGAVLTGFNLGHRVTALS